MRDRSLQKVRPGVIFILYVLLFSDSPNKLQGGPVKSSTIALLIALLTVIVWNVANARPVTEVNMQVIGIQLMGTGVNGYALPFEVISVLLLAAMIGAIVIAQLPLTKISMPNLVLFCIQTL